MATRKTSKTKTSKLSVETLIHEEDKRKNIPTAEYQSIMKRSEQEPIAVAYERRNRDLDPQLVWRGKDQQDGTDLVVPAPPLYIQEKVHPKALIDDLMKQSKDSSPEEAQSILFADFNGLPFEGAKTEFYQHDSHWTNRMILGDSLQVMSSLTEREGLRGKVQCVYFDPPYGIKFNSNFQWSTTSRDVKDGNFAHITREPEQVKAFRDTWRDGIHSYLTYLRDRLIVARELLTESGSIFVQISDENIHRVRMLLDEVFGDDNFISQIAYTSTGGLASGTLSRAGDYLLWYARCKDKIKYRDIVQPKPNPDEDSKSKYDQFEYSSGLRTTLSNAKTSDDSLPDGKIFRIDNIISQGSSENTVRRFVYQSREFDCGVNNHWKTNPAIGMPRLGMANRIDVSSKGKLGYVRYFGDYPIQRLSNLWSDIGGSVQSRSDPKVYVVQTGTSLVQRCILMTTDPGDLVVDPTCGSGTTATVSEQWGRRWITIDTSRVALALARARIMGAKYPYYILKDSKQGQEKIAELSQTIPSSHPVYGSIKQGFVYERVPHITLKSIANNAEIEVIYNKWQKKLAPLLDQLNKVLKKQFQDWEVPRDSDQKWPPQAKTLLQQWWQMKISCQKEIDSSIAAKADFEDLYDRPYVDKSRIRVAGPFTVESVSPHRVLGVNSDESILNESEHIPRELAGNRNFIDVILDNLRTAGVQQAHKSDKINFNSITPWPGQMICAVGTYSEEKSFKEKRAAIFIGPEFGTVSRPDLVEAAKEAGDADFEVLITCAFNYDARASEFSTLGKIPVLKARMNADLHMADELKNTGKGNLFVIFGEPDIEIKELKDDKIKVKINGVDIFNPSTGEVKSDGADGIACWFIDSDYNEESFFVRHAYFLGANDPYKALKSSLKAEIDKDAWDTLNSDTSRPFKKPESGRIAVKVINHLGDEVMKVFKVN